MTEEQIIIALAVFAGALYYTWKEAYKKGHEDGYGDACYDVAHGNITVTLNPPKE